MWPILAVLLALGFAPAAIYSHPQDLPPATQEEPSNTFFSGVIAAMPEGKIVVSRTALGKNDTRTFIVAPETKVEGKLKSRARVTVRFRTGDDGDVATHIIVRPSPQQSTKKG